MPCPNKLCRYLAPNGARCRQQSLLGACATPAVAGWRSRRETRHIAPTDAKTRRTATVSAKERQRATKSVKQRHLMVASLLRR